jgi:hypothetical protein
LIAKPGHVQQARSRQVCQLALHRTRARLR